MGDAQLLLEVQKQLMASQQLVQMTIMLVLVMMAKELFYLFRSFRRSYLALKNGDENAPATLKQLQNAMRVAEETAKARTKGAVQEITHSLDLRFTSLHEELRGTNKRLEKIRDIARDVRSFVIFGVKPERTAIADEQD